MSELTYIAVWPKVAVHVTKGKGAGEDVVVEKGGEIPAGVDNVALLVIVGAVTVKDQPAPADDAEAVSDGPPAKGAAKGAWVTWAVKNGADPAKAGSANKTDLVDAYGAEGTDELRAEFAPDAGDDGQS